MWNVQGVDMSKRQLKSLVLKSKVLIVSNAEPFAGEDKLPSLVNYLGFKNFGSNAMMGGTLCYYGIRT